MNDKTREEQRVTATPKAAYVHVPFCRHRCGYCNFTVVAGRDDLAEDYLRAIEIELSWLGAARPVETIFLGGGTPTQLSPPQLERLLKLVATWFPLAADGEFSVEVNPEDMGVEQVALLQRSGVTRVSLGVQSFDDSKLRVLERSHRAADIARCIDLLRPAIPSLSLDLIFGAPRETISTWRADLDQALALDPEHLSTYGLTYEPGTRFFARQRKAELHALPEETERDMYLFVIDRLTAAGFEHYEVSNFAKPAHRCRHNENYWLCGQYWGIGPGAASFVAGRRQTNHRSTTTYLRRVLAGESPIAESEYLTARARAHEVLVFGLRRLDGIDKYEFHAQTGFSLRELVGASLDWLTGEGLLGWCDQRLSLTREGLLVSDSIWPYLL